MYVVKRDGRKERMQYEKITSRLEKLCYGLDGLVVPETITEKVIGGIYDKITTVELDELAAQTAAYMATQHPDFSILAARISISNLHKQTEKVFSKVVKRCREHVHPKTKEKAPLIAEDVYDVVARHKETLDAAIAYDRDFGYDYFGFKTLERSYLMKIDGKIVERPQHMIMRVAVGIHGEDIPAALETYDMMSRKMFTHATPTLYNSGTPRPQLSSCFLLAMKEDSIEGIYDTLKRCACISKYAGGIGLSVHNVRATDSYIRGSNGTSNGIIPMLRVFNDTARYVDQGGGKRKGSFAIYLEPWHADIEQWLDLKKNHGNELERARDLFYGLWVPDLFMKRVEAGGEWSLFCPNEAPGLADCYGAEFEALYERYEREGRARKAIPAQQLWFSILDSQVETGTPYVLYKDACNSKSNQRHLGTIKSSNLCTEIIEYTDENEIAVCNLASINLAAHVRQKEEEGGCAFFDFQKLQHTAKIVCRNLNKVIDVNFYPVREAEESNKRHRPVGIGVQGLADALALLRYPYESRESKILNKRIFETIYYGAMEASIDLAERDGPYASYEGSPTSRGVLQFDMWGVEPTLDWTPIRDRLRRFGCRNSLLLAPMPTASTAQILGNNESFEPFTSNMYVRRVLAGEFPIVNKYLLKDMISLNLWNDQIRNQLVADRGSVQNLDIPDDLKQLYKTTWEIKQRAVIDMAADRAAFICQSQSLNIHMADPTPSKLTSMHFYAWNKGLKTGMYYLRTKPKADAIQFTVDQQMLQRNVVTPVLATPTKTHFPEDDTVCHSCGA
ncbi:hypothetical protein CTAYLR_007491 [Chrysophaeum taylorii]|uniref:Ribonucleoside-diphosphate reductase n=1 Tax=Chrysophaeum taylorii TaxID=2483200 RepID=A0AAD7XKT0_9STRA|nr:hypothetical protein CTAYLR_007491 [Chrysophaeum taylorii]